jgi:hypothetical protein
MYRNLYIGVVPSFASMAGRGYGTASGSSMQRSGSDNERRLVAMPLQFVIDEPR